MPISQNTALFALLGTTYGGNGTSTFALPNLQGASPLMPGQGNGLSLRDLGETGGEPTVTLLGTEMPVHSHTMQASNGGGGLTPAGNVWSKASHRGIDAYNSAPGTQPVMSSAAIGAAGGSQPHNNLMPYQVV